MDPQENNLKELIALSKKGDEGAFRAIYNTLSRPLFSFLLARVPSREDAKDILQEIFLDVWNALPRFSYSSEKEFYGFVYTIAKRKISRFYRSRINVVEYSDWYIQDNYEIEVEDYRAIQEAIESLQPSYQELLHLRYWSDLPFKEIASLLQISENAAKVRHHRAIKALIPLLEKDYGKEQ